MCCVPALQWLVGGGYVCVRNCVSNCVILLPSFPWKWHHAGSHQKFHGKTITFLAIPRESSPRSDITQLPLAAHSMFLPILQSSAGMKEHSVRIIPCSLKWRSPFYHLKRAHPLAGEKQAWQRCEWRKARKWRKAKWIIYISLKDAEREPHSSERLFSGRVREEPCQRWQKWSFRADNLQIHWGQVAFTWEIWKNSHVTWQFFENNATY